MKILEVPKMDVNLFTKETEGRIRTCPFRFKDTDNLERYAIGYTVFPPSRFPVYDVPVYGIMFEFDGELFWLSCSATNLMRLFNLTIQVP